MLPLYQVPSQVTGYMEECSMLACVSRNVLDTECHVRSQGLWSNMTWHHVHCVLPIYRMPSQVTGYMEECHMVSCVSKNSDTPSAV